MNNIRTIVIKNIKKYYKKYSTNNYNYNINRYSRLLNKYNIEKIKRCNICGELNKCDVIDIYNINKKTMCFFY